MKILIAAGGSGGHIFPAIALARELKKKDKDIDILFVGSNKQLDRRIFEKEKFAFSLLSANKMPYRLGLKVLPFFAALIFDLLKSLAIGLSYRPAVVVGFGGYVSCPVVAMARVLAIPTVVHEQNVVPGRANMFLFRIADRIAISFEETLRFLGPHEKKAVFTGNPIRASLFDVGRDNGIRSMGLDNDKFTILIIGGSQGAHFLNDAFVKALGGMDEKTREKLQVIHITGIRDYEWVRASYSGMKVKHRVYSFIDTIEEAYGASDLIVTRSGASAIFEAAFFGRPMILVPYPFAKAHQAENAKVFSERGAAIEVDEDDLSAEKFRARVMELVTDRERLNGMAAAARRLSMPASAEILAGIVIKEAGV